VRTYQDWLADFQSPPEPHFNEIDAEVIRENPRCYREGCDGTLAYRGLTSKRGQYFALAICDKCGHVEEF
jgi:hypothetical protein